MPLIKKTYSAEEIEDKYKSDLEACDKNFTQSLKDLKDPKQRKDIEQAYRQQTTLARKNYYTNLSNIIQQEKKIKLPIKKVRKDKETKPFKVEKKDYSRTAYQNFRIKSKLFLFNANVSLKNFLRSETPESIKYEQAKIKFFAKRTSLKIRTKLMIISDSISSYLTSVKDKIKSTSKKFYKLTIDLPEKFLGWVDKVRSRKREDPQQGKESRSKSESN